MEAMLEAQNRQINKLKHCLKRKEERIDFLLAKTETLGTEKTPKTISINLALAKSPRKQPPTDERNNKSKKRRRKETIVSCSVIHGGTVVKKLPVINAILDSQTFILKSDEFAVKTLKFKVIITNSMQKKCTDK